MYGPSTKKKSQLELAYRSQVPEDMAKRSVYEKTRSANVVVCKWCSALDSRTALFLDSSAFYHSRYGETSVEHTSETIYHVSLDPPSLEPWNSSELSHSFVLVILC